jgi:hypothetical protein
MVGDEAFRQDLRRWVHRVYVERERIAAERARVSIERLFDRERHFLTGLSAQLLVTIALLPWWGFWGVVAGLGVLYLGTMVSGAFCLRREGRLAATRSGESIQREVEAALAACPDLDADARARLIRLMNLADVHRTPRALALIRDELRELRALPGLSSWSFVPALVEVFEAASSRVVSRHAMIGSGGLGGPG